MKRIALFAICFASAVFAMEKDNPNPPTDNQSATCEEGSANMKEAEELLGKSLMGALNADENQEGKNKEIVSKKEDSPKSEKKPDFSNFGHLIALANSNSGNVNLPYGH